MATRSFAAVIGPVSETTMGNVTQARADAGA